MKQKKKILKFIVINTKQETTLNKTKYTNSNSVDQMDKSKNAKWSQNILK